MTALNMLLAAATSLAIGAGTARATTISTLGAEDTFFSDWGLPAADRFGQTITLDRAASIRSFTFRIYDAGRAISYLAELFRWDGSDTVGGALASVAGSTLGNGVATDYTATLGFTPVDAGQYALVFRATSEGAAAWGLATTNIYAGGNFVVGFSGGPLSNFEPAFDAAFAVTFDETAPVPLPGAFPLLFAGMGGLGLVARRKARGNTQTAH